MNPTNIKLGIGVALFITWVLLVVFQVTGSEDIISAIKLSLAGLGLYHVNERLPTTIETTVRKEAGNATLQETTKQSGFAAPSWLLVIAIGLLLAGCANIKFQWAASYKTDNIAGALQDVLNPATVLVAPVSPATTAATGVKPAEVAKP